MMAKSYEVISVFEASDRLFRARFDFGFNTVLVVYCDCNTLSIWSNYSHGATEVPIHVLIGAYHTTVTRFHNFLVSKRRDVSTSETLTFEDYDLF